MTYIDTRTYYVLYEDSPGLQNDEFQPGKGKKKSFGSRNRRTNFQSVKASQLVVSSKDQQKYLNHKALSRMKKKLPSFWETGFPIRGRVPNS